MRNSIFISLAGVLFAFNVYTQSYDYESIRKSLPKDALDEEFVVAYNREYYTFRQSDGKNPLTSRMEASIVIANLLKKRITYFESSDSYSTVQMLKAKYFDDVLKQLTPAAISLFTKRYESNGIFHNDFFVNSMTLGDPRKGIFELTYTKLFSDYKFLSIVPLYRSYLTLESEINIEVPTFLDLELIEMNFEGYSIQKSVSKTDAGTLYTFRLDDIPADDVCDYCPSAHHYQPHIILVYKSVMNGSRKTKLMPDTESLYAWYRSLVKQVDEKREALEPLVDKFRDIPKGEEQIIAVNDWIKTNIRYIAFESGIAGFKPDACQNVYNNRYGDCKGMANLCKNVLLELGYDARLVWIGTRNEVPYDYSITSLAVDNHMIAVVKLEDDFVFLDPTETYGRGLSYSFRIQGRPVIVEDGDNFILTNVPESLLDSDQVISNYKVEFEPNTKISLYNAEVKIEGELSKYVLSGYNGTLTVDREHSLELYLRPFSTGSFKLNSSEGLDGNDSSLKFNYEFASSEGVIDLEDEYYVDFDPNSDLENVTIKPNRKAAWFFNERYNRFTEIEIQIPENYAIKHFPEGFESKFDDFEISVSVNENNKKLTVSKKIAVYNGVVSNKNHEEFEKALNKLKEYYEDRLIIHKH